MYKPKLNQGGKTETIEVATLENAMHFTRYNQSVMADMLGINRGTLGRKLDRGDKHLVKVFRDAAGHVSNLEWINR